MTLLTILQNKRMFTVIGFGMLISISIGIAVPISPLIPSLITITALVVSIILYKNKLYDFLLVILALVYVGAQYQLKTVEMLRFVFLFLIVLLSLFWVWKRSIPINHVVLGIGLLALYSVFTSLQSYYPTVSFLKGVSLVLLTGFLLFVPPALQQLDPQQGALKHTLRLFFYLAIVVVISNAIFYFLFPTSSNVRIGGTSLLNDRFRGWFTNPNDIATFLGVFLIPILWFEAANQKKGLVKFATRFIFLLAAIELLATQSRAGILSGLISLFVLILVTKKMPSRVLILATMVIFFAIVLIENPRANFIKTFIYRNEVKLEGSGRLPYWFDAWNRFLLKPVFGSGLGVSNSNISQEGIVFSSSRYSIQKDNSYMAALEEFGIVGNFFLIIFLLLPMMKNCWKGIYSFQLSLNETKPVLIAIVVSGLLNAIFESWLFSPGNLFCISFWIFAYFLASNETFIPAASTASA